MGDGGKAVARGSQAAPWDPQAAAAQGMTQGPHATTRWSQEPASFDLIISLYVQCLKDVNQGIEK
uniref:Uncharacterized protein n=1 Tax=Oryza sativa subsp. japonica TaxID=39947 RepID=Q6K6P4_ORYSJ|nr:hypothetical protein [Oryza sativa Japonica Group]